jgi:hypothetical protein
VRKPLLDLQGLPDVPALVAGQRFEPLSEAEPQKARDRRSDLDARQVEAIGLTSQLPSRP